LEPDDQPVGRVHVDDPGEQLELEPVRVGRANLVDPGQGVREVEGGQVDGGVGLIGGHAAPPQPMTSRSWGNSLSNTSGRVAGSLKGAGGATRLLRSPAYRAVRNPCFFAGAMSRVKFDPTCRISDGMIPRAAAAWAAARKSVSDGFFARFSAEITRSGPGITA